MASSGRRPARPRFAVMQVACCPAVSDERISLEDCRRLMGTACSLSDVELEILRDQMYGVADIMISVKVEQAGEREARLTVDNGLITAEHVSVSQALVH
jgi:hypothetical protein